METSLLRSSQSDDAPLLATSTEKSTSSIPPMVGVTRGDNLEAVLPCLRVSLVHPILPLG